MEVEAESDGIIRGLSAAVGEKLPVGTVIAWICAPGEAFVPPSEEAGGAGETSAEAARGDDTGAEDRTCARAREEETAATATAHLVCDRPRATPLARRIARENELDLARIAGSGPRGRVLHADVAAALGKERAPSRQFRKLRGARLRAQLLYTLRDGRGRPLVMIHGFGSEGGSWRPLLNHLGIDGRVLAVDLPGHGRSALGEIDRLRRPGRLPRGGPARGGHRRI